MSVDALQVLICEELEWLVFSRPEGSGAAVMDLSHQEFLRFAITLVEKERGAYLRNICDSLSTERW